MLVQWIYTFGVLHYLQELILTLAALSNVGVIKCGIN